MLLDYSCVSLFPPPLDFPSRSSMATYKMACMESNLGNLQAKALGSEQPSGQT